MTRFVERYLAPLLLSIFLMLGGASAGGYVANAVLQIIAIVVVGWLVLSRRLPVLPRSAKLPLALLALAAVLMLIQLLPMPEALWSRLPGRAEVAHGFTLAWAGSPWLPISLEPDATVSALLSLLPPLAMILAVYAASGYGRVYAVYVLVLFTLVSIGLGLAQEMRDVDSPLYVYTITNRGSPVGFFANRNHLATLLLTAMPFVGALAVSPNRRGHKGSSDARIGRRLLAACVGAVLVLGLVYIRSDAGWLLCGPCFLASVAIFWRGERGGSPKMVRIAAAGAIVAAVALVLFAPIAIRDAGDKLTSSGSQKRGVIVTTTLRAGARYFPVGAGGGSFSVIYPSFEDPEGATVEYINHAHSDYAELFLEYGAPGLILVIAALGLWVRLLPVAWRSSDIEGGFARAGFVAVGMVAAHSLVDYPLRTAAIASVVAMAAALLVAPQVAEAPTLHSNRRRQKPSKRTIILGLAEEQPRLSDGLLGSAH